MAPDLPFDTDVAFDDDDPTERFAVQKCPSCSALTTVPLCVATSPCDACGKPLEVAPFPSSFL